MAREAIGVKRYVARLTGEEPAHLEAMPRKGKHGAKTLITVRILLKADVSEAGEGLSDDEIIEQLETSASMVYRMRKQRVEEGFAAVLTRKPRTRSSRPRIFDGEKQASLPAAIEWLSDNGSCDPSIETRNFAKGIGFPPVTTPVESPQSNGMAEAFVRTCKGDYVAVNPTPDAATVIREPPKWFEHDNELHPHRALGYRSPREFIASRSTEKSVDSRN